MREQIGFNDIVQRLQAASCSDRRLDAEVMCLALGPDARINPVEDLDGWGLDCLKAGKRRHLLASEDVPYLTRYLDAATEVVAQTRPQDGASIMYRAIRAAPPPQEAEPVEAFVGRLARLIAAELVTKLARANIPSERLAA